MARVRRRVPALVICRSPRQLSPRAPVVAPQLRRERARHLRYLLERDPLIFFPPPQR